MAHIAEPFTLWESPSSDNIFIRSDNGKGHVLICSREKGYIRYDLNERRLLHGWPIPFRLQVTSIAVDNKDVYSLIFGYKTLCKWHSQTLNPLDGTVCDFGDEIIFCHHPVALNNISDLLLITKNGQVFLQSEFEKEDSKDEHQSDSCIYSRVVYLEESTACCITLVQKDNHVYARVFFVQQSVGSDGSLKVSEKQRLHLHTWQQAHRIISCCIVENPLTVILLSDNGVLYSVNIEKAARLNSTGQVFCANLLIFARGTDLLPLQCQLVEVHSSYVALVYLADAEGSHGVIRLFSTKFLAKVEEREIKMGTPSRKEVEPMRILGVAYCHDQLVIGSSCGVFACTISSQTPSLALVLGTLDARSTREHYEAPSEPLLLRKTKNLPTSAKQDSEPFGLGKKLSLLKLLASPNEPPDLLKFEKTLATFLNSFEDNETDMTDVQTENGGTESDGKVEENVVVPKKKRKFIRKISSYVVPRELLDSIVKRLITEDDLWSDQIIEILIRKQLISSCHYSSLLNKLFERNSLTLVEYFFTYLRGIQESSIVTCIRHILQQQIEIRKQTRNSETADKIRPSLKNEQENVDDGDPELLRRPFNIRYNIPWTSDFQRHFEKEQSGINCPIDDDLALVLEKTLAHSGNEFTLEKQLQALTIEETEILLMYLEYLLFVCYERNNKTLEEKGVRKITVNHSQVVDWTTHIINAQFTSLILSPKLKELLSRMQFSIRQELRAEHCLAQLRPFVNQLDQCSRLPRGREALYDFQRITL